MVKNQDLIIHHTLQDMINTHKNFERMRSNANSEEEAEDAWWEQKLFYNLEGRYRCPDRKVRRAYDKWERKFTFRVQRFRDRMIARNPEKYAYKPRQEIS